MENKKNSEAQLLVEGWIEKKNQFKKRKKNMTQVSMINLRPRSLIWMGSISSINLTT
jgi:hypothetical protein